MCFFFLHIYIEDSLLLCAHKKIGYSQHKFLKFENSWNFCLDIVFDPTFMHSSDLFLILKSYLNYQEIICLEVFSLATQKNKSSRVFSKKSAYDLRKLTYREFEAWWEERQWYDSSLIDTFETYALRLEFVPEHVLRFVKKNNITLMSFYESLKPSYPWETDKVYNLFENFIDFSNYNEFWMLSPKYNYLKKPTKK